MSSTLTRMLAVAAAASLVAIVMGTAVGAQNPPARGMRWTKAAPFPEPEEPAAEIAALLDQTKCRRSRAAASRSSS